jgi:hypothetical protein
MLYMDGDQQTLEVAVRSTEWDSYCCYIVHVI